MLLMLNKPTNFFDDSSGSSGWDLSTDRHPVGRLVCLFFLMAVPLVLISGRLFQVQTQLLPEIVAEFEKTTEEFEPVSSRDGRVLSRDGLVLAEDVRRYHISMHYRWLQEPPDSTWLRNQALHRLPKAFRRDRERIDEAVREVEKQRTQLWSRLASVTQRDSEEVRASLQAVQRRVERIRRHVEARRTARFESAGNTLADHDQSLPWYESAWKRVRQELTTPPHRSVDEPVIIREELDYHRVVMDIPFELALEIESHPELFPGIQIDRETERRYPLGEVASHVIGVRTDRQPDELKADESSGARRVGRSGVERQFDRIITGTPGRRRTVRDRRGEILESRVIEPPQNGRDVQLTLHVGLQREAERMLDEALGQAGSRLGPQGGSIVVLDVRTGEVVSLANAPRFDLNLLIHPEPDQWQTVMDDSRQPMFPRATRMTVAPGSVFKTLSAIAVLESGIIDPDEPRDCQGFLHSPNRYRCYVYRHYGVGHGELTLADAIARSCNVYFYSSAEELGPQPFVDWARRFGFGAPTGLDLPGERGGNLPHPEQSRNGRRVPWYKGDTLGLAIGQSRLTVTPLQIARMMAAVANGGFLVQPHVFASSRDSTSAELKVTEEATPQRIPIPGLQRETLERVREGLTMVVANPRGTGYKTVRNETVTVAGKTGTAEVGGGRNDHAWFAGFVPAEQPRYAFAIVLENGGSGGSAAGPLARRLAESLVELGLVHRSGQLAVRD